MDGVHTKDNITETVKKTNLWNVLKKILIWTCLIVGGGLLLVVLYQIFQVLFVCAILLIAWLAPKGRR